MKISVVGRRTLKRYRKYCKIFPSRRAAFRAAKRDAGIPVSSHPQKVVRSQTASGKEYGLDSRNVRLYIFGIFIAGVVVEFHIREDKEAFYPDGKSKQLPHFNSGEPPKKLKKHHYYRKKK